MAGAPAHTNSTQIFVLNKQTSQKNAETGAKT